MATEILAVPEENLTEVIAIIRCGLRHILTDTQLVMVTDETEEQLIKWCNEKETYSKQLQDE